jgi:uncharacterized protein YqgV (UPF0045/DUF77 family)
MQGNIDRGLTEAEAKVVRRALAHAKALGEAVKEVLEIVEEGGLALTKTEWYDALDDLIGELDEAMDLIGRVRGATRREGERRVSEQR